ncbi:hypothetical protein ANAEL_04148 [Anaerolineales bacterium]|nr:hypothetical protein ANAEL_04148 [Anaerolineales bacterium]
MSELRIRDLDNPIRELRERLNLVYAYLDRTEQLLKQAGSAADELHTLSHQLDTQVPQVREQVQTTLKSLDDAATVMQRQLSHLQDWSQTQTIDSDMTIECISSILMLSVRLASVVFSPERLERMAKESDPVSIDTLRQYWREWLNEIASYLVLVIPVAFSLERIDSAGLLGDIYRQSLRELGAQCVKFASISSQPIEKLRDDSSESRTMKFFRGPLDKNVMF